MENMNLKTRENLTTTNLEEIKEIAKALLHDSLTAESLEKAKDFADDLAVVVEYYNRTSKDLFYAAAKASDDPMKYAILGFFYPGIKVKDEADNITKTVTQVIADKEIAVDLGDLHSKIDGGIGADKNWIYSLQRFNFHLTVRAAERLGKKLDMDNFYMHEIAKQRDLGRNPCSNTQLLKTLQVIVDEMIGPDYKATSHDVNYLVDVYATDSKKSKTAVSAANHKTLRNYMKKVCYRILTGGIGYDVEQREIKKQG